MELAKEQELKVAREQELKGAEEARAIERKRKDDERLKFEADTRAQREQEKKVRLKAEKDAAKAAKVASTTSLRSSSRGLVTLNSPSELVQELRNAGDNVVELIFYVLYSCYAFLFCRFLWTGLPIGVVRANKSYDLMLSSLVSQPHEYIS